MDKSKSSTLSHCMSAEELITLAGKRRINSKRLPKRGRKRCTVSKSVDEQECVKKKQNELAVLLAEERLTKLANLSCGEWNEQTALAEINTMTGGYWNTLGFIKDGKMMLQPEEALFLIEMGALELCYKGLPVSMQQAYTLILPSAFPMHKYQVFCHLLRLGFIVYRYVYKSRHNTDLVTRTDQEFSKLSSIPLVSPLQADCTQNILKKLQVIQQANLNEIASWARTDEQYTVDFNVYLPNSQFKKSQCGPPDFAVKVVSYDEQFPNIECISNTIHILKPIPLKFAINENGDIVFYSFDDITIPISS